MDLSQTLFTFPLESESARNLWYREMYPLLMGGKDESKGKSSNKDIPIIIVWLNVKRVSKLTEAGMEWVRLECGGGCVCLYMCESGGIGYSV